MNERSSRRSSFKLTGGWRTAAILGGIGAVGVLVAVLSPKEPPASFRA